MKHIFITGCPRSGTTMLASMLGNHSSCVVTPESDFFIDFIYKYFSNKSNSVKISEFVSFLNKNYRFKQWQIDANKIRNLPEHLNFFSFNNVVENTVTLFANEHLESQKNELIRIDHTPSSIKSFNLINELFPESKFVFIIRDPRAVYSSVKNLDWGANTSIRLSEIWNEYAALYFSFKTLYPERVCLVRYEDILINPTSQLKHLCRFTGITYSDSMLEGKGFKIPGYTALQHNLVGKELDLKRIKKWKDELNLEDILIIESQCQNIMSAFNYNVSQEINYRINAKKKLKMLGYELYYFIKNKFRKKSRKKMT